MNDWQSFFRGKKITVMGLGLLGRGVGDVKFLAEEGADIIVTDLKKAEDLKESLEVLSLAKLGQAAKRIKFVLGAHRLRDFRDRDFILKAAGVPVDSPYISEARKNGVPVEMSTALFAAFAMEMGATIVGVTGTRGKSTVTQLIYEILNKACDAEKKKRTIFLGGNVRGVATLAFLRDLKKGDIAVLELDSWQLQGFAERKISPQISVFTTFLPDHLNYYKGAAANSSKGSDRAMEAYLDDKAAIFKFQTSNDSLIIGSQAEPFIRKKYGASIKSKIIVPDPKKIPADWNIQIPGEHNLYNIALTIEAVRAVGDRDKTIIPDRLIKIAVENFKGVPGRLEFLREINGVKIYNDTTATTPDAVIAALEALGQSRHLSRDQKPGQGLNIVLIAGGTDKNLNMTGLVTVIPKFCKKVILLPGSGTDRLLAENQSAGKGKSSPAIKIEPIKVQNLQEAVSKALEESGRGDVIILSPAFASFGMFKNEFDRGEQFVAIVNSL